MPGEKIVVIGAGIGGLTAALLLAHDGCDVTIVEKEQAAGGKMRRIVVGGLPIDAGPTVFTMRHVFEEIFDRVGESLDDHVSLTSADILARHAWNARDRLDLFADQERSIDAIGNFAGLASANSFRQFSREAARMYTTLDGPFIRSSKTSPVGLSWRIGPRKLGGLWGIRPFETLWAALGRHFADPRLRQLFGRYATYSGSSPFQAPATLMLIAHVEAMGVWAIKGGMHALATAMAKIAQARGVSLLYGQTCCEITSSGVRLGSGEWIDASRVVANCDPAAITSGLLGQEATRAVPTSAVSKRALSALVPLYSATASHFPLSLHNVFFSTDYRAEFDEIAAGRLPVEPTVYVCAQDRPTGAAVAPSAPERLQLIINAPANGDTRVFSATEINRCEQATLDRLQMCGLDLQIHDRLLITPAAFDQLFPATGGALYGQATHGAMAAFARPGARTKLGWLYLAGGGTHPGAGVPMAALSGVQAASALLEDRASTYRSSPAVMPGGISMRSVTTGNSA